MKAQELRIGNWVNYVFEDKDWGNVIMDGNGIVRLANINFDSTHYAKKEIFSPIPLTEEWLTRFGFRHKKTEKANSYTKYFFMINFVTEGRYKGKTFIKVANFKPDINNFLYVHQLQNLYYALTGEEL